MRAVVHDDYGAPDVLRIEEVERPTPGDGDVLVRVLATTVTRTDCHRRAGGFWRLMLGVRRPRKRILGMEFAGVVEVVGANVGEFSVGDEVFGITWFGANAEFICVPESKHIAHKPATMTFEEAAAVLDGAFNALMCLRKTDVREGTKLLVYGASGSIGTAGVQLAKHLGADVTAVCNTKNVELVRSLGADRVIDYLNEDFTKNGERYDVVIDAVGKHSFLRCRRVLVPGGRFIATDNLVNLVWALASKVGSRKVRLPTGPRATKREVLFLKQLIEAGEFRAVIDRTYPLADVREATRYVETQQKTGNVVLLLDGGRT